jgi:GNAT superfamily N-acetyltransferase
VHVAAWQQAYRGLLSDAYLDAIRPEDRAARYRFGSTTRDGRASVIARDGPVIVGFATMGPSRDEDAAECGELYALYVEPAMWRRGVGRVLVADARARLRRRGYREALLWVLEGNERARQFYVTDGWVHDGCAREEDVWGVTVPVVRYRRLLE